MNNKEDMAMKFMTNIKTLTALLIVGAAFAACSSSDEIINETQQPANPTGKYTLVIKASKSTNAATRALDLDETTNTLNALWAEDEEVKVYTANEIYYGVYVAGESLNCTLSASAVSSDGTSCTLTGNIDPSGLSEGQKLYLQYNGGDKTGVVAPSQDGTMQTIADYYDKAYAVVTIQSIGSETVSTDDASFTNQQAIVKFAFKNKANNAVISPSAIILSVNVDPTLEEGPRGVAISMAEAAGMTLPYMSNFTIPDATYTENGSGIVYLAIPNKLENPGIKDMYVFTITAIVGDEFYSLTKSGFPFSNGQYYEITAKMTKLVWDGDLSKLTAELPEAFATVTDGMTITGTLGVNKKISIAAGATVTLDGVSINADGTWDSGDYAGITCLGDATIILKDGTTNTVKGFNGDYPGIFVPGDKDDPTKNKTLTIQGTGTLNASSNGYAAGIGGGWDISCGNIVIESGTITATGQYGAAGIGSGEFGGCGDITISGGTVTATGAYDAAGIGSGDRGACGDIMITSDVTKVTATKGSNDAASIGAGWGGTCGTVTIEYGANVIQN